MLHLRAASDPEMQEWVVSCNWTAIMIIRVQLCRSVVLQDVLERALLLAFQMKCLEDNDASPVPSTPARPPPANNVAAGSKLQRLVLKVPAGEAKLGMHIGMVMDIGKNGKVIRIQIININIVQNRKSTHPIPVSPVNKTFNKTCVTRWFDVACFIIWAFADRCARRY